MSSKCRRCGTSAYPTESTNYDGALYHTTCFKCLMCGGSLTPASIAQLNGKLYCKNCFERTFKETGGNYDKFRRRDEGDVPYYTSGPQVDDNPETECYGCKKSLGDKRAVTAKGHKWHADCWTCEDCKSPFWDGKEHSELGRCWMKGEQVICTSCAEADGSPCGNCCEIINFKLQGGFVNSIGKRWHHNCWGCAVCRKPASKVQLHLSKSGIPHCTACTPPPGQDVIPYNGWGGKNWSTDESKLKTCYSCQKKITGLIRTVFDKTWHPECFKCFHCKSPFGPKSKYLPKGQSAVCESCFEKLSQPCPECGLPVTENGVTTSFDKTWHQKCFCCNICKSKLDDGKYKEHPLQPGVPLCGTCINQVNSASGKGVKCAHCGTPFSSKATYYSRGDSAICETCHAALSAVCPECKQKVTERGVATMNKTWHEKCFVCNNCKKALEGGRFKESPLRPGVPLCGTCVGKVSD